VATGGGGFAALSWPVHTPRTTLRPVVPGDRDAVHAYRSRADVTTYLGRGPMTPAEVDERIAGDLRRRLPGHPEPLLALVIEVEGSDVEGSDAEGGDVQVQSRVVGDCMVKLQPDDDGARTAFIGYTLHPDHAGRGLATEVARALVSLCFRELGVATVKADVFRPHVASQRVLEKAGFRRIGMTPAGSEGGGHPRMDDYLYAVTAAEWASAPSAGAGR